MLWLIKLHSSITGNKNSLTAYMCLTPGTLESLRTFCTQSFITNFMIVSVNIRSQ